MGHMVVMEQLTCLMTIACHCREVQEEQERLEPQLMRGAKTLVGEVFTGAEVYPYTQPTDKAPAVAAVVVLVMVDSMDTPVLVHLVAYISE